MNYPLSIKKPRIILTRSGRDFAEAAAVWTMDKAVEAMIRRAKTAETAREPSICWPVGSTQTQNGGFYDVLVDAYGAQSSEELPAFCNTVLNGRSLLSCTRVIQLDEAEGSTLFRDTLKARIQTPLNIDDCLCSYFVGSAGDLEEQARIRARALDEDPLDIFIGGLGMMDPVTRKGAHIGYNESGSTPTDVTRVLQLEQGSLDTLASYDGSDVTRVSGRAVTVGLKEILQSRAALIMVSGAHKAETLHAVLEDEISKDRPGSFMRTHPNATFLVDEDAAGTLFDDTNDYDLSR